MSDEIVFYTHPMSRGRIVRWMLEELGRPYRTVVLDYGTTMKAPDYLAINPMGKVPTVVDRGAVVTECAAICAYLADAYPASGLAPAPGDPARADWLRWLFFAAGPVESAVTNRSLGVQVPPERKGMVGYGSLEEVVDTLDGWLSRHEWFAAGRFTAADVYAGSQVAWGLQFGSLPKRPALVDYAARIQARPAAVRARGLDDALLAQQAPKRG